MSASENAYDILESYVSCERKSDSKTVASYVHSLRDCFEPFVHKHITVSNSAGGGLGVFASQNMEEGTLVLIEKPVAFVPDCSQASPQLSHIDGSDSFILIQYVLDHYDAKVEDCLRSLYPIRENSRKNTDLTGVPPELLQGLKALLPVDIAPESVVRAVQLNSLGCYTFPELVSYSEHLRFLSGTALYKTASMFNHSCEPNVNHYSLGDVTFFRLLRDVEEGDELYISYIGSDLLCESKSIRDEFLSSRDFSCACSKCSRPETMDDEWLEEFELQDRVSINLHKAGNERVAYIRKLLHEHDYITRDRLEITFMLCRQIGSAAISDWKALLEATRDTVDLSTVIICAHYLVRVGEDESVAERMLRVARICLGDELGSKKSIGRILSITDFASDPNFLDKWNRLP